MARNPARKFTREIGEIANELARHVAVEVMNDLAEKGPEWDGTFKDSWIAIPAGGGASGSTGGGYPYTIDNVPKLSTKLTDMRRATKLTIENIQPYAPYALDLQEGRFNPPNFPRPDKGRVPKGKVVKAGVRDGSGPTLRGDITSSPEGESQITAELDWYRTYVKGGAMKKAMVRGVKVGIKAK